jgi:hypothetical protein
MFNRVLSPGGDRASHENAQGPRAAASGSDVGRGVDLARLISWDTPLAWFEAVAIVQELCAVLVSTRAGGGEAGLEPEDVAITPGGTVEVRGGIGQGMPAVGQVAHLLLALLEEAPSLPVQLRLMALQEVSPAPTGVTLRDWSARLAAFERPGRQRAIRDVYERFMQLPVRQPKPPPKVPARKRAAAAGPRWWNSPKARNAAVSIALLVAAGLAAAWLWSVVVPMLSGGRDRPQGDAKATAGDEASLSAAAAERIRAAAFRIWGASAARQAAPAPDAALAGQPLVVVVPEVLPSAPPFEAAAEPRAPDVAAGTHAVAADATVYSVGDTAVVPPALLRPRLPTRPSTGVREENLPQVELLVSPSGEVESVKLLTQPAGVMSTMMLSAIKTWRFEPAASEGHPVRYRLRLRLTNQ